MTRILLRSPAGIDALHYLYRTTPPAPLADAPPRHERSTRIFCYIAAGLFVGWIGGCFLIGGLL